EPRSNHSAGDFIDIRREQQSLSALAGFLGLAFAAGAPGKDVTQYGGAYVTAEFFEALGTPARAGRMFTRDLDPPGTGRKAVISSKVWRQLYDERPDAIGQQIRLNGEAYSVVGVVPPRTAWPEGTDIWVLSAKDVPPSPLDAGGTATDREVRYFEAIGRI